MIVLLCELLIITRDANKNLSTQVSLSTIPSMEHQNDT